MLEETFCIFMHAAMLWAGTAPGHCCPFYLSNNTLMFACVTGRVSTVYSVNLYNQTMRTLFYIRYPIDAMTYYNGTFFWHRSGSLEVWSSTGDVYNVPKSKLCLLKARGGKLLIVGKDWLMVYDIVKKRFITGFSGATCPADISPDGKYIIFKDLTTNMYDVLSLQNLTMVKRYPGYYKSVSWGKTIALTRPGCSLIGDKKYRFGGTFVAMGNVPFIISDRCKGALVLYDGMDYCLEIGIKPQYMIAWKNMVVMKVYDVLVVSKFELK